MAVPTPRTWVAAEFVTATLNNVEIRDTENWLLNPPRASANRTTTVSTTTAVWTRVDLTSELYDSGSIHDNSTNPSRLTAPETYLYEVHAQVRWEANATGVRFVAVCKNSAGTYNAANLVAQRMQTTTWSEATFQGLSVDVALNAGDYVEMFGQQQTGGALSAFGGGAGQTFMSIRGVAKQ
jgi:hypothetical protein